jgi:hypothetical protein
VLPSAVVYLCLFGRRRRYPLAAVYLLPFSCRLLATLWLFSAFVFCLFIHHAFWLSSTYVFQLLSTCCPSAVVYLLPFDRFAPLCQPLFEFESVVALLSS